MKTLILAAFIITIGLASCSVTQPQDGVYYTNPNYQYDPNYYPYDSRYQQVYDYNTGRYYYVPVTPVYTRPVYQNGNYGSDNYRRDNDRRENDRRDYRENNVRRENPVVQPNNQQRVNETKRLPDGTTISPNGNVTLPNGQVRRNNR